MPSPPPLAINPSPFNPLLLITKLQSELAGVCWVDYHLGIVHTVGRHHLPMGSTSHHGFEAPAISGVLVGSAEFLGFFRALNCDPHPKVDVLKHLLKLHFRGSKTTPHCSHREWESNGTLTIVSPSPSLTTTSASPRMHHLHVLLLQASALPLSLSLSLPPSLPRSLAHSLTDGSEVMIL